MGNIECCSRKDEETNTYMETNVPILYQNSNSEIKSNGIIENQLKNYRVQAGADHEKNIENFEPETPTEIIQSRTAAPGGVAADSLHPAEEQIIHLTSIEDQQPNEHDREKSQQTEQSHYSQLDIELIENNTENKVLIEEKLCLRQQLIDEFYTETLRNAENRVGEFNIKKHIDYNISLNDLKYDENELIEEILLIKNPDTIYYGFRNKFNQNHGFGIQLQRGGIKHEGYWTEDKFEPFGRHINTHGVVEEGKFINGALNGEGLESKPHSSYRGTFVNGVKEGFGVYENAKEKFEGFFSKNLKNGKGELFFKQSGNLYSGEFVAGKMNGKCVYSWKSGEKYIGEMRDGEFNGFGEYTWPTGEHYIGNYVNGKRHGNGQFTWPDGRVFKGAFKDNVAQEDELFLQIN